MSWWSRLKIWFGGDTAAPEAADDAPVSPPVSPPAPQPEPPGVSWLAADQNRFGVPVIDLTPITQNMLSTTRNPQATAKAVSWNRSIGEELSGEITVAKEHPCTLRYPAETILPDGLLYLPQKMEDKWVIAWRDGQIRMARSWTGEVLIVADARHEGDALVVDRIKVTEDNPLPIFGDPVQIFDWILRTHALGEILPLPVDSDGADLLLRVPLSVFSPFGRKAVCAAKVWDPPPPSRPLRSDGAMLRAVGTSDLARIQTLYEAGEPLSPPGTFGGYTPLHLAVLRGNVAVITLLLDLGADVNALADRAMSALVVGLVHKAPLDVLQLLVARGADPHHQNTEGFNAMHALAEINRSEVLPWLLSLGLDLETTTRHGHTAVHIAAALGHVDALNALLEAGARPDAPSPGGTPREVATAEGKPESVSALDAFAQTRMS